MSAPPPECVSASVPKAGNRPEENEDAVAVAPGVLRFAVADGATEGWESGPWAARLGAAFVRRPPTPPDFPEWLGEVRRGWPPDRASGPVPWYASAKRDEGSFAALAGLELRRRGARAWAWKAVAVGDCCLLHVAGGAPRASFPLASPGEFGSRPALIPSSAAARCPEPEWLAGRAGAGDLFLLASDAAAARLLDPAAFPPALRAALESLRTGDPAAISAWCREVQSVTNDDVSLIAIRLPPDPEAP